VAGGVLKPLMVLALGGEELSVLGGSQPLLVDWLGLLASSLLVKHSLHAMETILLLLPPTVLKPLPPSLLLRRLPPLLGPAPCLPRHLREWLVAAAAVSPSLQQGKRLLFILLLRDLGLQFHIFQYPLNISHLRLQIRNELPLLLVRVLQFLVLQAAILNNFVVFFSFTTFKATHVLLDVQHLFWCQLIKDFLEQVDDVYLLSKIKNFRRVIINILDLLRDRRKILLQDLR
jgi:hypothetical protein